MLAMKNGDTVRAPLVLPLLDVLHEQVRAAAATAEDDADVVAVVVGDLEARVGQRLLGRRDAHDDVAIGAADGLEVHPLRAVEVVDLAADLGLVRRRVPARDLVQAASGR